MALNWAISLLADYLAHILPTDELDRRINNWGNDWAIDYTPHGRRSYMFKNSAKTMTTRRRSGRN